MELLKRKIQNWEHCYKIASSKEGLKDFKTLLVINANQPHINFGNHLVATEEKEVIISDGKEKMIRKTVYKTFNELLKEFAPEK